MTRQRVAQIVWCFILMVTLFVVIAPLYYYGLKEMGVVITGGFMGGFSLWFHRDVWNQDAWME